MTTSSRAGKTPWLLLSPAGLVLLAVTVAPIVFLVYTSFTSYDQRSLFTGGYDVVGLDQYRPLLADPAFWRSLLRTVLFTAAMVAGSVVVGMAVSHLMTLTPRTVRTLMTLSLICAWAMPNVASSIGCSSPATAWSTGC